MSYFNEQADQLMEGVFPPTNYRNCCNHNTTGGAIGTEIKEFKTKVEKVISLCPYVPLPL
jgi:hypothetical protein